MEKKKTVAIIGTNGLPAKYGGFETLTHYLAEYLGKEFEIIVYCSKTPKEKRLKEYNSAKLKYFPLKANGWQSLFYDFFTIIHAYFNYENLIILGFSGAFAFPLNVFFRKNIIFNIGGIEWKKVRGSKWSRNLEIHMKKWMERLCVKISDAVIIDNESFKEYLIEKYNTKPILAEYGGDHAIHFPVSEKIKTKYSFINNTYDLTVSRAQEDMNIHLVIEAYKSIPNRTVVIISNWQISEYGKKLFSQNKNRYKNIILLPAIYDLEELNAIRGNCNVYLHTHSLCGTAPSLVEAMFLKLPVVAFDVPANRSTTEDKALYFSDADSLILLMNNTLNDTFRNVGMEMSEISKRRYTWDRIVNIYKKHIK